MQRTTTKNKKINISRRRDGNNYINSKTILSDESNRWTDEGHPQYEVSLFLHTKYIF